MRLSTAAMLMLALFGGVRSSRAQVVAPSGSAPPQSAVDAGNAAPVDASTQKARAALDAMVKAMGGEQWLSLQNEYEEGRISGFYHGNPTGVIDKFYDWRVPLGPERANLTKKQNVVEFYDEHSCTEVTYKGAHPQPQKDCDEYLRGRAHSIDVAVRVWRKDPRTILEYEGKKLAETHLAEQVTLINSDNDAITIQMDADTHLPLARIFEWRDPVYHDKNTETEEYDNYHTIQGIPTPFNITRLHNGDMIQQRFLFGAAYNVKVPPDWFDVQATAKKITQ